MDGRPFDLLSLQNNLDRVSVYSTKAVCKSDEKKPEQHVAETRYLDVGTLLVSMLLGLKTTEMHVTKHTE